MKWYKRVDWYEIGMIILAVFVVRTVLLLISSFNLNIPWYVEYGAAIAAGAYVGYNFRKWKLTNDPGRTTKDAEGDSEDPG